MKGYGPATYGDRIAAVYDEFFAPEDSQDAAGFLASVARGGPALELGIGTGRVALPLRRLGVEVHGVEASRRMVAKLRAKRGGKGIPVTIGGIADVPVSEPFRLVFVVFNTMFAVLTRDDQIRCFRNVADRLTPRGVFVVEAFVPDLARYDRGQRTETHDLAPNRMQLDVTTVDRMTQTISGQHVVITERGIKLYPFEMRYAYPSELDLMARLAGLRLRERFGGWHHEPFTSESDRHVSTYQAAAKRSR